jgi:hypothetical protein
MGSMPNVAVFPFLSRLLQTLDLCFDYAIDKPRFRSGHDKLPCLRGYSVISKTQRTKRSMIKPGLCQSIYVQVLTSHFVLEAQK